MAAPESLTTTELARQLNMPQRTLNWRLRQRGIPRYRDPADERRYIVRVEDVARLQTPRLVVRKAQETTA